MRMTLCPLFSGSSGNSIFLSCGGVRLLVDAGMSAAREEAALREIGVDVRELDGVLVTHEHVDHVRGPLLFLAPSGASSSISSFWKRIGSVKCSFV